MTPEVEQLFDDANGDLALGELEAAVEKYRRCTELDPDFFDAWHALGMALSVPSAPPPRARGFDSYGISGDDSQVVGPVTDSNCPTEGGVPCCPVPGGGLRSVGK